MGGIRVIINDEQVEAIESVANTLRGMGMFSPHLHPDDKKLILEKARELDELFWSVTYLEKKEESE